jgi:hypothetical protein
MIWPDYKEGMDINVRHIKQKDLPTWVTSSNGAAPQPAEDPQVRNMYNIAVEAELL